MLELEAQIPALEEMYEIISSVVTLARNTHADLERKERQIINMTSPINQIPTETLTTIFELVICPPKNRRSESSWYLPGPSESQGRRPQTLAVCHHWWNTATHSPTLWSDAVISVSIGAKVTEGTLKNVQQHLSRSKSAPLNVEMFYPTLGYGDHGITEDIRFARLVALLLPHAYRYKTFKCYVRSTDSRLVFPLPGQLRALRELAVGSRSIPGSGSGDIVPLVGRDAQCKPVTLDITSQALLGLVARIDFTDLEIITVNDCSQEGEQWSIEFLVQCKALQAFYLIESSLSSSSIILPASSIHLPSLISLGIAHFQLISIVSLLDVPNLEHFDFSVPAYEEVEEEAMIETIYGLITPTKFPALRTLTIRYLGRRFHEPIGGDPPGLLSFRTNPNLEALDVNDREYGLSVIQLVADNIINYEHLWFIRIRVWLHPFNPQNIDFWTIRFKLSMLQAMLDKKHNIQIQWVAQSAMDNAGNIHPALAALTAFQASNENRVFVKTTGNTDLLSLEDIVGPSYLPGESF